MCQRLGKIRLKKLHIVQIITHCVDSCTLDHGRNAFDRHYLPGHTCQRQGEITQTAKQVHDTLVFCRRQPLQGLLDHRGIDRRVDLNEISRSPGQLQVPRLQSVAQRIAGAGRLGLAVAMQPQLRAMPGAKRLQQRHIGFGKRRGVAQQHGGRDTAEQLDVTQRLRFAEAFQHARQLIHDGLQSLYQHRTVFNADDVLAGGCTEPHIQPLGLGIPANRDPRASAISQLGTAQRCRPFIRHNIRHTH